MHRITAGFQGGFSVSKSTLLTRKQLNQLCFPASAHRALRPQAACWPWSWWSPSKYDPTADWEEAQGTQVGLSTALSPKSLWDQHRLQRRSALLHFCAVVVIRRSPANPTLGRLFLCQLVNPGYISGSLQCSAFMGTLKKIN